MGVQTTVVFTDLIGSTGAFEALGNVKATRAVTELTGWIGGIVVRHGGRVVKTLGDGVLATFDTGPAAIRAVVEIQRLHQKNAQNTGPALLLPIRVGVATGEVVLVNGDCYGDAVNVAARLSDLAGPDQIWVNEAARKNAREGDGVHYRLLGAISVRGRALPCTVFQVEWKEDVASDYLTRQGDMDPTVHGQLFDALGGEITLRYADKPKLFRSFEMPVHVGRAHNAEYVVSDPRVSRMHVRVDWRNGGFVLTDLSSFGTWVRFANSAGDMLLRREECVLNGSGEFGLGAPFTDVTVPSVHFTVQS